MLKVSGTDFKITGTIFKRIKWKTYNFDEEL